MESKKFSILGYVLGSSCGSCPDDLAVRAMIDDAFKSAKAILQEYMKGLDKGAKLLLERETITPQIFPRCFHFRAGSRH